MPEKEIASLVEKLGGPEEHSAVKRIRELSGGFSNVALRVYREASRYQVRAACVFYSMSEAAANNEDAFTLGIEAIKDRSKIVRSRACQLLSFALKQEAIPYLRSALADPQLKASTEDFDAAIDAIVHQNHHYFVDREHSGMVKMSIVSSSH